MWRNDGEHSIIASDEKLPGSSRFLGSTVVSAGVRYKENGRRGAHAFGGMTQRPQISVRELERISVPQNTFFGHVCAVERKATLWVTDGRIEGIAWLAERR